MQALTGMTRRAFALIAIAVTASMPVYVEAQNAPPKRVRGEIVSLQDSQLTVRERSGETVQVRLNDPVTVNAVVKADIGAISSGTYIGTAAVPQPGGTLRAVEVLIFPEAMRGAAEGHFPWDLTPETTMTNAAVESVVSEVSGRAMKLKYKDGEKTVMVPPDAPIVTFEPADRAMLKPGAHVFITTTRQPDGSLAASRVAVGKDGLIPPM